MYVPSTVALTFKLGENDHADRVFINKAGKLDPPYENTAEGMAQAGADLELGLSTHLANRTMNLIGVGQTPIAEVVAGLKTGKLLGWQYHREGYPEAKWQVQLGFAKDVSKKNAGYASKKPGGKKAKKSPAKSKQIRGLFS